MREDIYQRLIELTEEEEKILNGEENVNKSLYTDNGEFIVDSRKLLQTGELIDIRRHTRFVHFPKHKHNYIEFNYVYKGQLTQNIDDRKITLKQGEFIFLNQYITHEIEASEEEDIIINFIIKPEFFDYIITLLEDESLISKFLLTTLYKDYSEGEYLYFKVADKNYVQELAEKIITELYEPSIMSKATIKLLVGLLLVELVKRSKDIETYSANNYDKLLIIQSFKYIDKYYRNANLFELAKKLNQPHYKISKLIKKHTKMTFKELLQQKKLSKAIELLKLTEYSIVEIIDLVGYENPTYFYKIFKGKYGVTPKEYRGKKLHED